MSRKRLGDVELEIYQIVSKLQSASVQDVVDQISKKRKVAYTSIMTLMKNLSDKQYLKFKQVGKKYIYSPDLQPSELKQNILTKTLEKVFNGSALDMVQHLVKTEKVSKSELEEIRKLLNNLEK